MSDPDYTLKVTGPARRQLQQLPERVAVAIVEFLTTAVIENPMRVSKPLHGDLEGLRSARRGDYRVLLRVEADTRSVVVVRIAHRADVYRPR